MTLYQYPLETFQTALKCATSRGLMNDSFVLMDYRPDSEKTMDEFK